MISNEGKDNTGCNPPRFYETVGNMASYFDYTIEFFEDFYDVARMEKYLLFDVSGRLITLINYSVLVYQLMNYCKPGRGALTGL